MSAVAPPPARACTGTLIWPIGNGGLSEGGAAEPEGHEHTAMTTATAAATIPDSARTPGGYPQYCREKRWTVSPRQANAGLSRLLQPRRPRGVRSLYPRGHCTPHRGAKVSTPGSLTDRPWCY